MPCKEKRRAARSFWPLRRGWAALLLGLLVATCVGGCRGGSEQARDLQQRRLQACARDPYCLRP